MGQSDETVPSRPKVAPGIEDASTQKGPLSPTPIGPEAAVTAGWPLAGAGRASSSGETPGFEKRGFQGEGGQGTVWRALDLDLGRLVAMKELRPTLAKDPASLARFLAESELAGKLEHPGIVPIHSRGRDAQGAPYYVMKLVEGQTLKEAIAQAWTEESGPERLANVRRLARRFLTVCQALAYAHDRGVVHRDVKPGNIVHGAFDETVLLDWGLARPFGPEGPQVKGRAIGGGALETATGAVLGTPAFMPPEQAQGRGAEVGPLSDVYGLGAVLYAVATGHAPIESTSGSEAVAKAARGEFLPPRKRWPLCPRPLEAIVLKAMALRPEDRYPSARALALDVEQWLVGAPVLAWPDPWWLKARRWVARHKVLAAALAAALFVGALAIVADRSARGERARQWVAALETAEPRALPVLLRQLGDLGRGEVFSRAKAALARSAPDREDRIRLALLPYDPDQLGPLKGAALAAAPEMASVFRDALRPHAEALAGPFWDALRLDDVDQGVRAASALALWAPGDDRWRDVAGRLADRLLKEDGALWEDMVAPVSVRLVDRWGTVHRSLAGASSQEAQGRRSRALERLKAHARTSPLAMADVLPDLDASEFQEALARLSVPELLGPARRALAGAVDAKGPGPFDPKLMPLDEDRDDANDRRRARALLALAALGEERRDGPLMAPSPDPNVRTHLIAQSNLVPQGWRSVWERLKAGARPARFGLVLALGEAPPEAPDDRKALADWALAEYRTEPLAGNHSALAWLLTRLGPEAEAAARRIDEGRRQAGPAPGTDWYVNRQGQTFVVLPQERLAIGAHEVTSDQFQVFWKAQGKDPRAEQAVYGPSGDSPALAATWDDAVAYAAWLSESEGAPPPFQYRLPTVSEWARAARAGASSVRAIGRSGLWLDRYARHASQTASPVGRRWPNDWGLFDALGNVGEWCGDVPPEGRDDGRRDMRGLNFASVPEYVKESTEELYDKSIVNAGMGFRLARALPP